MDSEKCLSERERIGLREEDVFLWEAKHSTIVERGLATYGWWQRTKGSQPLSTPPDRCIGLCAYLCGWGSLLHREPPPPKRVRESQAPQVPGVKVSAYLEG